MNDFIICKWCNKPVKRIYGKHIKFSHPGKTSNDYKKEFPGEPLMCDSDRKNISRNSGKHMSQEKYRKMASEKSKGQNNINSKTKTTKQQRKERSPFSKDFYIKRGLSSEDRTVFINSALKDREFTTNINYYLKRSYSQKEAEVKLKDRQTTFSLEKCIIKYGEEGGRKRWEKRQANWKAKVFNKNTHIGKGTSKLSERIINEIKIHNDNNDKLLYDKLEKFIYDKELKRVYKYDLTNAKTKRIIEINGTFWHSKEGLYEDDYIHKVRKKSAKEIREFDKRKHDTAKSYGYDILVIWEDDYWLNPEETIKKCVNFIYENNI